jgi:3',5'-cyclic AMP phosphodiesterase CpdA
MTPLIDPRLGDVEDDASSTKRRSLLAMAGSLLAEISLPKLIATWVLLILLPAVLLGLAPLIGSAWLAAFSSKVAALFSESWPISLLLVLFVLGWLGGPPLWRGAEQGFWSLNSVLVQPGYAIARECLNHLTERLISRDGGGCPTRFRAATAAGAGLILCAIGLSVVVFAWPASRWLGAIEDLTSPHRLIGPALANAAVLLGGYLAAAALAWGFADATMFQPHDFHGFGEASSEGKVWRVAHLSDLHMVGERYGFRIESGRSGPCGNEPVVRALERLEKEHRQLPIDIVLITGDITDAGRSVEWAEFFDVLSRFPAIAKRTFILPGNHDINVVDRANPARFDLPTNPGRRLRQLRALSAIAAVQGGRVRVVDPSTDALGGFLDDALAVHRAEIAEFADAGTFRHSMRLGQVWSDVFPLVMPPSMQSGLGLVLLNSTAETHFSFTNALGLVSHAQARRVLAVMRQFPNACWIVALHHHLVEYPRPVSALSERVGTALINGSWLVRQLEPLGRRVIFMHGHRHIDWIGACGGMRIISAASPTMEAKDDKPASFLVHRLTASSRDGLDLLEPERIDIAASEVEAPTGVPRRNAS